MSLTDQPIEGTIMTNTNLQSRGINVATSDEDVLAIKTARREATSLMHSSGANQTSINVDQLVMKVNDADSELSTIALPGETLEQTWARVEGDPESSHRMRVLVSNSRSARLSLGTEQDTLKNQASAFDSDNFDRELNEVTHAYEVAVEPLVRAQQRKYGIDAGTAKQNVEDEIAAKGQARVLPIFDRIMRRFTAKYPDQMARAERS